MVSYDIVPPKITVNTWVCLPEITWISDNASVGGEKALSRKVNLLPQILQCSRINFE